MPLGDKAKAALPLRAATLKQQAMITRHSGKAASGKLVWNQHYTVSCIIECNGPYYENKFTFQIENVFKLKSPCKFKFLGMAIQTLPTDEDARTNMIQLMNQKVFILSCEWW